MVAGTTFKEIFENMKRRHQKKYGKAPQHLILDRESYNRLLVEMNLEFKQQGIGAVAKLERICDMWIVFKDDTILFDIEPF